MSSSYRFLKAAVVMTLGFQWIERRPWLFACHFAVALLMAGTGAMRVGSETAQRGKESK